MNNRTVRRGFALGMVLLLVTAVAISAQMNQPMAQSQQQNAEALRHYTWKSRTEIQRDGETKNVQVAQLRYEPDGRLQKVMLSSTPPQQLPTRGLRGRIAQKKKENFLEMLDQLGALAKSYSQLPADKMQRFMATAVVTPEMQGQDKRFRLGGNDILQPGDVMVLWVDAVTRKLRKIEIQTTLEQQPVSIVSNFQDLPQGPTYMAHSVVDYPSEELRLITENFDYERLTR